MPIGVGAQEFQPLPEEQPDAARGRVNQHRITCLDGIARGDQELRGQALEHDGGSGIEGDRVGQLHEPLDRHHSTVAIGARRQRVRHPISTEKPAAPGPNSSTTPAASAPGISGVEGHGYTPVRK